MQIEIAVLANVIHSRVRGNGDIKIQKHIETQTQIPYIWKKWNGCHTKTYELQSLPNLVLTQIQGNRVIATSFWRLNCCFLNTWGNGEITIKQHIWIPQCCRTQFSPYQGNNYTEVYGDCSVEKRNFSPRSRKMEELLYRSIWRLRCSQT